MQIEGIRVLVGNMLEENGMEFRSIPVLEWAVDGCAITAWIDAEAFRLAVDAQDMVCLADAAPLQLYIEWVVEDKTAGLSRVIVLALTGPMVVAMAYGLPGSILDRKVKPPEMPATTDPDPVDMTGAILALFQALDDETRAALLICGESSVVEEGREAIGELIGPDWLTGPLGDIVGADGVDLLVYALWRFLNGRAELEPDALRARLHMLGSNPAEWRK
jgi:hypothetical protein